jgi:uncharacterized membrane protein YcaP (DUF421 family)
VWVKCSAGVPLSCPFWCGRTKRAQMSALDVLTTIKIGKYIYIALQGLRSPFLWTQVVSYKTISGFFSIVLNVQMPSYHLSDN